MLFCGEGVATFGEALTERLGDLAVLADHSPPTRSPATLAAMGSERHRRGDHDDVKVIEPLYLRRPSISTPRRPV